MSGEDENAMASGGVDEVKREEDMSKLNELFTLMGAKPKTDSKEELQRWIIDYAESLRQSTFPPATSASSTDAVANAIPTTASAPTTATSTTSSGGIGLVSSASTVQPVIVAGRKPWLMKFSGEDGYDLWRHQLLSLRQEGHQPRDIADAIRSSLTGKAGTLLISLGPDATVDNILDKLDSVYGQVDAEADVLATFYSARQGPQESVADWSCRLEGMFSRVKRQTNFSGDTDEALRQMFWTGLRQELKDASVYYFDSVKSFDDLRKELRRVEKQHPPASTNKKKISVLQVCTTNSKGRQRL
jgi:hypothetical protein